MNRKTPLGILNTKKFNMKKPLSILFVCIGNTCRSPMAESIMENCIKERNLNWTVDSCGLRSWNVGRRPDERCLKVLEENDLKTDHFAREITREDFEKFDYILCMDSYNLRELKHKAAMYGVDKSKIELLGIYSDLEEPNIPDPYFQTNIGAFRAVYDHIRGSCINFIGCHKYRCRKNVLMCKEFYKRR